VFEELNGVLSKDKGMTRLSHLRFIAYVC